MPKSTHATRAAELQSVTPRMLKSESGVDVRQKLSPVADTLSTALISRALLRAGLAQKEAAIIMGISESLLGRQLHGTEHLSWQRLSLLPDPFWVELLFLIAEERGICRVYRGLEEIRKTGT